MQTGYRALRQLFRRTLLRARKNTSHRGGASAYATSFTTHHHVATRRRHVQSRSSGQTFDGPPLDDIAPIELLTVFLRAPFQFSKRAAREAAEFSRGGVEFLRVIGATRLECGKPAAEAGELIRRQVGNSFGDFFDFHLRSVAQAWLSDRREIERPPVRTKHWRCMTAVGPKRPN